MVQLRQTQQAIKICLTERWYSWEEARIAAMEDEEVDLYADTENGQSAYIPKEQIEVRRKELRTNTNAFANILRTPLVPPALHFHHWMRLMRTLGKTWPSTLHARKFAHDQSSSASNDV
jgi:hypothetical protein